MKLALLVAASVCVGALSTYPHMAAQRGWRVGELFAPSGKVVHLVALACIVTILSAAIVSAIVGRLNWWVMALLPVAYLVGGSLLAGILRRNSPALLLIAPATALAAAILQ